MTGFASIIGSSTVIRHVQHLVLKVSELDTPVLITGEVGTGKESVGRAIHEKSPRSSHDFISVRCLPDAQEMNQLLFGVVDGNKRKMGVLEKAGSGTVFLDDIAVLDPDTQSRLLDFIAKGQGYPVNGKQPIKIQARILCSSCRDLEGFVRDRKFREDLYYKLASSALYIPPLRERKEDIPNIVDFFIKKHNQARNKSLSGISNEALSAFLQYEWSYNIGELDNLIDNIVVLKRNNFIDVCDLPPRLRKFITDDIDKFFEKASQKKPEKKTEERVMNDLSKNIAFHEQASGNKTRLGSSGKGSHSPSRFDSAASRLGLEESTTEIDSFVRKEIDLGNGIDFYRVVEEFENRLIAEALRRTNHNKNRAAQLLSMNRTTLVEKLKKRQNAHLMKQENSRVKKNTAYTIIDGLGNEQSSSSYEGMGFMTKEDTNPARSS